MKLQEIIEIVGGTLKGDGNLEITGASGLGFAGPGDISYVGEAKFLPELKDSAAAAIFIQNETETDKAQIIHPTPALAFAKTLARLHPTEKPPAGVHPSATVADSASLGVDVTIASNVCIESGAVIGDRCVLQANVVVGKNCLFAAQVGIGGNTVIGDDVILYGQAGISHNVSIGSKVVVHAKSGVSKSLEEGKAYFGYPANEARTMYKELAALRHLPTFSANYYEK